MSTGTDYDLTFDIIHHVIEWCRATSQEECKLVLQDLKKMILFQQWVRESVNQNHKHCQWVRAQYELVGDIALKEMLSKVPSMVINI